MLTQPPCYSYSARCFLNTVWNQVTTLSLRYDLYCKMYLVSQPLFLFHWPFSPFLVTPLFHLFAPSLSFSFVMLPFHDHSLALLFHVLDLNKILNLHIMYPFFLLNLLIEFIIIFSSFLCPTLISRMMFKAIAFDFMEGH